MKDNFASSVTLKPKIEADQFVNKNNEKLFIIVQRQFAEPK